MIGLELVFVFSFAFVPLLTIMIWLVHGIILPQFYLKVGEDVAAPQPKTRISTDEDKLMAEAWAEVEECLSKQDDKASP